MEDQISGKNQSCRKSELFGRPCSISILKDLMTQIISHSLNYNASYLIQEYFSETLKLSTD